MLGRKGYLRIPHRSDLPALAAADAYPFRSLEQAFVQAKPGMAGPALDDHSLTLSEKRSSLQQEWNQVCIAGGDGDPAYHTI
jgi:hypothetical protein